MNSLKWLKKGTCLAGINKSLLKDLSTRVASTTKVNVSGVAGFDLMEKGQWSNRSTYQKIYKREIIDHSKTFQANILNNMV